MDIEAKLELIMAMSPVIRVGQQLTALTLLRSLGLSKHAAEINRVLPRLKRHAINSRTIRGDFSVTLEERLSHDL